jgi:hypothetical protein
MPAGGFCKLPGGTVVVALTLPDPVYEGQAVRVVVHSANRARALTRLRNAGLRSVYLRGNTEPPTPDEIDAVLHHPDGLVWRSAPDDTHPYSHTQQLWRSVRSLRCVVRRPVGPAPACR